MQAVSSEGQDVTRPIRRTSFTWDPDTESRAEVWERIKTHVQDELGRVYAEHIQDRRVARRRAHPNYARNQELVQAAQQGTSIGELTRRFGITYQRVREIIRTELRWLVRNGPDQLSGEDRHPAQHGRASDRLVDNAVPHTTMVMPDP